MNFISYIRARHNLILKLLIVFFGSLLIAWLWPKTEIKGHMVGSFDAVWQHADLVAENDFYLKKSEAELNREYREIEKEAPLFFEKNDEETIVKRKQFEELKTKHPSDYTLLKPLLDTIYKRGIIETIDEKDVQRKILVYSEGEATQAVYFNFFTINAAVNFIDKELGKLNPDKKPGVNYLDYLAIGYFCNKNKTTWYINSKKEQVSLYKTSVRKQDIIVKQGEALTNDKRFLINSYFNSLNKNATYGTLQFFARWLMAFVLLLVLLFYLIFFRKQIFGQNKQVLFLYLILFVSVFSCFLFNRYGLMLKALPFALVAIMVRVFFDSRTALFTHLISVLITSFYMSDKLEFIVLQLVAGIGTLFTVAEMRKRQQILNSVIVVFLLYVIVFAAYHAGFGNPELLKKITAYVPFAISAMLVMMAYPFIYLTEKVFGFISDFKLLELSDLNQPLLRRLSQEVPGTFQHSLQVANLAEEAIYYIGGNTLLVRTGAMYHDVGKLYNPRFFTENQVNGYSPHIEMQPLESARTIIEHVIKGIELAKEHRLPEQIIDFIRTHHGTTSVGYFLTLYKREKELSQSEEARFRYPGPIPFSKETAVLMMADGVEAASRSLQVKNAVAINDLVDEIIDYKISQNQFINSDITFKDITVIKKIFKKRLMNIYHVRIEYPK